MRSDRERLLDILEAIEKIEKRVGSDRKAFEQDEMLQVWLVHGYFDIDLEIVWKAAVNDLPALKPQIEAIEKDFDPGEQ